jgi:GNAT superfamily N-acetyltransferase
MQSQEQAINGVRVQQATPDLWEAWRSIRLRSLLEDPDAFGSTHEHEAEFDEATWRSRVDGTGGPAVLGYVDETPVGMGAGWIFEPGRLMVVAMWTEPAWRGHGVGTRILEHVVDWSREHGLSTVLWVADANPAARRLYERHGFRANGETAPIRDGSELTMSRLVLGD